jgi:CBS domain containing-hemolysin-like protein
VANKITTIEGILAKIVGTISKEGKVETHFIIREITEKEYCITSCIFHGEVPREYVGKRVKLEIEKKRKYFGLVKKVYETLSLEEPANEPAELPSMIGVRY